MAIVVACLSFTFGSSAVVPEEGNELGGELAAGAAAAARPEISPYDRVIGRVQRVDGVTFRDEPAFRLAKWAATGHESLTSAFVTARTDRGYFDIFHLGEGIYLTSSFIARTLEEAAGHYELEIADKHACLGIRVSHDSLGGIALVRIDTPEPIVGGYGDIGGELVGAKAHVLVRGPVNYYHDSGMLCLSGWGTVLCEHTVQPSRLAEWQWESASPISDAVDAKRFVLTRGVPCLIGVEGALMLNQEGAVVGVLTASRPIDDQFVHSYSQIDKGWLERQTAILKALPAEACRLPDRSKSSCCTVA